MDRYRESDRCHTSVLDGVTTCVAMSERPDHAGYLRSVPPVRQPPRLRYLRLAAQRSLVIDDSLASFQFLAAGIRLQTVAAVMKRSRTSLYKLWETQNDFHTDLALYLVVHNDYEASSAELPWRRSVSHPEPPSQVGDVPDPVELTRFALGLVQDQILTDPWIAVRAATIGCGNAGELAPIRAAVEQQRIQDLGTTLDAIFPIAGRSLVAPMQPRDLALGFWCLADGFATLARALPRLQDEVVDFDDGQGSRPWGLFAYIARCFLDASVVPSETTAASTVAVENEATVTGIDRSWTPLQLEALEVGASLFTDRLVASGDKDGPQDLTGLAQVNIANLARDAGVTRRSVYDLWPTSEDLRLDLLRHLLEAETASVATTLERRTRSRTSVAPGVVLGSLVRDVDPRRLSPGEVACTFLLDVHNSSARDILATGSAAMLETVVDAVDRVWPAPASSNPANGSLVTATAAIALSTGATRLLRTCPAATDRLTLIDRSLAPALKAVLDHRDAPTV